MRRPTSTTRGRALVVTPRDGTATLPAFTPETPVDGWSPATVSAAALAYADDVADRVALSHRRLAKCAERALYVALPPSVKKAQAVERLRAFATRPAPPAAEHDVNELAPF